MLNWIKFFVLITTFFVVSFGFGQYAVDFDGASDGTAASTYGFTNHTLNGINWTGVQAIIPTTPLAADWFNGTRSLRLRGYSTSIVEMTQNKPNGIGTISFNYQLYGSDSQVSWLIDYSTDNGSNWINIGTITAGATVTNFSNNVNVAGNIRIRIRHNSGGNTSTNRRMNIDDFIITDYVASANPEPTNHPTTFGCTTISSSEINLTWTDATGGQEPDGYLIKWSDVSYADITDPTDGSTANGPNSTTVAQGVETVAVSGLSQNTNYFFKIYPYTNSGANIDYKINGAIEQTDCLTDEAPCANESFDNIPTGSANTYLTRTWVGDDGFEFTTTDSRTDQSISGQSVTIRNGSFTGYGITGGIGELTMSTRRDFAGGTGNLTITINGVDFGTVPYDATVQTTTISNIDVAGTFDITISTPGNGDRITIDDLSWTCYTSTNTLSITSLSATNYIFDCLDPVSGSVDFTTTGVYDAGNIIYVQLSDASGSFDTPLNIGSLATTAISGTISFTIPNGTALGANYRIRLFSTEPGILSLDNGTDITLSEDPCNITVSAVSSLNFTVDCYSSDAGSVDFSATGVYNSGNTFSVELSDAAGSFASPIVIGSLTGGGAEGTDPTGTISINIPSGTASGVGYRVRVVSTDPAVIGEDNGSDIEITLTNCELSIDAVSSLTINVTCDTPGSETLDFAGLGTFNVGNIIHAELSDAFGSFANPSIIGTLSGAGAEGTNPSGTMDLIFPSGVPSGSTYRIRLVTSDPASTSDDNGVDIELISEVCPTQLPASVGLLINEFSNGPTGGTGEKEYYEFVVAGRCGETVDVRGYIIDDNNGTFTTDYSAPTGTGIAGGHLRLTNHTQWSAIPVGSLIVVYNEDDPNASLPADDPFDADNDSLYVIPHKFSDLLEINTTIPNTSVPDSNYTPAVYGSTSWSALNIRNAGDAIQVRMPDGVYFHGVSYGGTEISGGPNNMKIFNDGMGGMSGWFNSGDVFNATNWSVGDVSISGNETPGLPNNAANYEWLKLMRDPFTSVCPVTVLPITLGDFSGYYNGSHSVLNWETHSEQNNDYFALYHSTNGKTFERIGTVSGSGNTTTLLNYSFEHRTPHPGINYYKLKSVDYDGTMHDKGIIAVQVEMNHVFYDQITQSIQMNYTSDYAVYGSDGRLVTRVQHQNAIPFEGYGVYVVIDERLGKSYKLGIY
jgi:hypothetical protein